MKHFNTAYAVIKQLSALALITLLSTATGFGQCSSLPAARLIQAAGCVGTSVLTIGSGPDYAVPHMTESQQTCALNEYINNFSFNTITNNGTGCSSNEDNYTFYSSLNTQVTPGSTYNFSIESPGLIDQMGYAIWIDFNQNGNFDDAGEMVYTTAPTNGTVTGTVTIPLTATLGITRMRVRLGSTEWFAAGDGETTTDMGETEDYLITIGSPTAVTYSWTSNPVGFTSFAAFPALPVSINTTYMLTVTDSTLGCSHTTSVTVDSNHIYPSAYGNNVWNAYAFNGQNFNSYEGLYTDTNLTFSSTARWNSTGSPSNASGYTGCPADTTSHSVKYRRKGFPCGFYSLNIPQHSAGTSLYINSSLVFHDTACCTPRTNVWTGFLDGNTTVEFNWQGGVGTSLGSLAFNLISGIPVAGPVTGTATLCEGTGSVIYTVDSVPGASTYSWSLPSGATIATGANTNSITVNFASNATSGMVSVSGVNECGTGPVSSKNVTVAPLPMVGMSLFHEMGMCNQMITLSGGTPAGGTYSGPGVNNGIFYPRVGAGTHNITYTYVDTNGCSNTAYSAITVNALPVVTQSPYPSVGVCNSAIALTNGTPSGGTYSGTGVSSNTFNPSIGRGIYDITYTYTDTYGCHSSSVSSIAVDGMPIVSAGAYPSFGSCNPVFSLTNGTPAGGTYTGNGVSNGKFDPSNGEGIYTITYTYTDTHGCSSSSTADISVQGFTVINAGYYPTVGACNSTFSLNNGTPAGGTFSGTGVNSGLSTFNPSVGAGTYAVTYSYTDNHGCSSTSTTNITVDGDPLVLAGPDLTFGVCNNPVVLTNGSPAGGVFDGQGVTNGTFYPSTGAGDYSVFYYYADQHGCRGLGAKHITVEPLPTVNAGADMTVVECNDPIFLTGGSPSGGSFSGEGVSNGTFYPSTGTGDYTVNYYYADQFGCSNIANKTITVTSCVTGIEEVNDASVVSLYPNPAHDVVSVEVKSASTEMKSITVSDITGKEIMALGNISGNKTTLNVNDLAKGMYLIRINCNDNTLVKKITIE